MTAAHPEGDQRVSVLALGALGVVYGDIGTSPLYAIKECFNPEFGLDPTPDNVIGICSLMLWSIILVVVGKYLSYVTRADNRGEGGILALLALISQSGSKLHPRVYSLAVTAALIGTALLGADGTITPAITVLGAMEGLNVVADGLQPLVVPLSIAILVGLFLIQRTGTERISAVFGPAMLVWFLCIGVAGIFPILEEPGIFAALNPARGVGLLLTHGWHGFLVLGAVLLVFTGVEALYADMGHFGRRAIAAAWYPIVMPALLLNYFGQGAHIIRHPEDISNPFFALAPGWTIYPMVAIATIAAIIASQALITGSFSLAQQAVQLGYSPRLTIRHTSESTIGQIFVPEINTLLMLTCIALVLIFGSSSGLAGAYGISVMGTMVITTFLMFIVSYKGWGWKRSWSLLLLFGLLAIDLPFLLANLPKIAHGGWFPMVVCAIVFSIMTTWKRGRSALAARMRSTFVPLEEFVRDVLQKPPLRVPGTAVFMTGNPSVVPPALKHHFIHNKVLHEEILLLSIVTADVPSVPMRSVLSVRDHGGGFYEVIATFGFMQTPKIERIIRLLKVQAGVETKEDDTTYFLGRDVLLIDGPERMVRWRKMLFAFLVRNSLPATAYYGIPPNRVVELGMQVRL